MVRRHEILFLYDVKDANPNGDPARENMPRYDPDTETVFVSDVRIKRTIRDCLERSGETIFVTSKDVIETLSEAFINSEDPQLRTLGEYLKSQENDSKKLQELAAELGIKAKKKDETLKYVVRKLMPKIKELLTNMFIDVRLFGIVTAYENKDFGHIHGPVQFRFGRSLNRTKPQSHKLSSKQPRAEGDVTGKFGEKWTVPYVLIGTYGMVNEAVAQETGLSEEDVRKMIDCLWKGTEQLQSASKAVHRPILLVDVIWKEGNEHLIGNLDEFVRIRKEEKDITWNGEHAEDGKLIRGLSDYVIDVTELVKVLEKYKGHIEEIKILVNPEVEERIEGLRELRGLTGNED